ncbi:MAG: hypothetical protein HQL91_10565 [Magnetococcales bacterium]|nr:hypothetical protein [Magnetococcales bacterium]
MKRQAVGRNRVWAKGVGMVALCGVLAVAWSPDPVRASEKDQYVASVITMLRLHAEAIRQLATHDFKYSRNLARHVTGLQNTFGLLGPMDWHVSTSITLQKSNPGPVLKEADFEKMADQCQKSMKGLYQASIQHVEEKASAEPVIKALDEVQSKCTGCHSLLEGVAPDVWGTGHKGK